MRKIIVYCLFIVYCFLLSACDSEFEVVGMEIVNYPNRIIYIAGIDDSLDLTGGIVNLFQKNRKIFEVDMASSDNSNTISHNIDFDTPGIYVVTVSAYKGEDKFTIQVISEQDLLDLLDKDSK